jgi:hypothetical protein
MCPAMIVSTLPLLSPVLLALTQAEHTPPTIWETFATTGSALSHVLAAEPFSAPGIFLCVVRAGGAEGLGPFSGPTELVVLGAAVLVAGAGVVAYFLRRRRAQEPSDGVVRSESQRAAFRQAQELEEKLLSQDGKVRLRSLMGLINMLRQLTPPDRPERIRRIAYQLCLDWPLIGKDSQVGHQIKNQIPRMLGPLLRQLKEALALLAKDTKLANISVSATAILKWIG